MYDVGIELPIWWMPSTVPCKVSCYCILRTSAATRPHLPVLFIKLVKRLDRKLYVSFRRVTWSGHDFEMLSSVVHPVPTSAYIPMAIHRSVSQVIDADQVDVFCVSHARSNTPKPYTRYLIKEMRSPAGAPSTAVYVRMFVVGRSHISA